MVEFASLLASAVISAVVALVVTEYQLRRKKSLEEASELADWYDQSERFANDVRKALERHRDEPTEGINFEGLQNEMNLLEHQISSHANEGSVNGTSPEVIKALEHLADACNGAASETIHLNCLEEFEEHYDTIREAANSVEESVRDADT